MFDWQALLNLRAIYRGVYVVGRRYLVNRKAVTGIKIGER